MYYPSEHTEFEIKNYQIYSFDDININVNTNSDNSEEGSNSGSLGPGAIAGISIGCIVAVGAISFCVYWFAFRHKPEKVQAE